MSVLKMTIVGHLGQDAITNIVNGKQVINMSVAHSEKWKDQNGQEKERTTWVSCAFWTDRTALVPYLKKGTLVFVEGQPEATIYDNQRGEKMAQLRMRVANVNLLGSKKEDNPNNSSSQSNQPASQSNGTDVAQDMEDGLPF